MGRIASQIKGQATIEFTFSMIVVIFLIIGMVGIMRWVGMDLAERRIAHDDSLTNGTTPEEQLNPDFSRIKHIDAVYHGDIIR